MKTKEANEIKRLVRARSLRELHALVMWNGYAAFELAIEYARQLGYDEGSDLADALTGEDDG